MNYSEEFFTGEKTTLAEFAASCARAFFFGAEVPKNAKQLLDKQGRRDFKKELAELSKELEKANNHDAFFEKLKKERDYMIKYVEDINAGNVRISELFAKVSGWEPPAELSSLKNHMLTQLEAVNVDAGPAVKRLEHLNNVIDLRLKDPYTFDLHFKKDMKQKQMIIEEVKKQQAEDEKIEADTQQWLDAFYGAFPELVVKEESKKEEKKQEKKEHKKEETA